MKKICIVLALYLFALTGVSAKANENREECDCESVVIEEVDVFDESVDEASVADLIYIPINDSVENPNGNLRNAPGVSIRNMRTYSWYSNDLLFQHNNQPGFTINSSSQYGYSVSVQAKVGAGLGLSNNDISASVGFNVTQSYSVGVSDVWTVPYSYNGKKVISGDTLGYAIYQRSDFDVYFLGAKTGSTFAAKPIGVRFLHQVNLSGQCVIV